MNTKKMLAVLLSVIVLVLSFAGCGISSNKPEPEPSKEPAATAAEETKAEAPKSVVRTAADRADVTGATESITPKDFPKAFLPGIEDVGAIPLKKYKIAISNGDMANEWRRTFWDDMMAFGNKYKEKYGIEIISANSGNNSTKQLQDIQSLLAQKPDMLIMAPNESGPLSAVVDLCEKAGVSLITVDRTVDKKPGEGKYISAIQSDGYSNGVANGISLVNKLTKKYGEPKGRVAEIAGVLGSSVAQMRSMGMRRVLADYPNIKIVTVRPGEFDRQTSFKAAQDILTVNKKGELDAIMGSCDTSSIAAIEAIKSAGRTELLGYIWGVDGTIEAFDAIAKGEMEETNECPPYFGMIAFEYAIQYLNGKDIPAIVPTPQRDFAMDTPAKADFMKILIEKAKEQKLVFASSSLGGYDVLVPADMEMFKKYYPKPYWEQPAAYLEEFKPYTEAK